MSRDEFILNDHIARITNALERIADALEVAPLQVTVNNNSDHEALKKAVDGWAERNNRPGGLLR
jgi:hypothetical protein